jgi:hypothetical protein
LTKIAVLVETILGFTRLVHLETKIKIRNHDLLESWTPCTVTTGRKDFMEQSKRCIVLIDSFQLEGSSQSKLRLVKEG